MSNIDCRPAQRWQSARAGVLPAFSVLPVFLAFSCLSFLRNTVSFSYPYLYGEDGAWIGEIMMRGFWSYAFEGRADFPVVGLLALEAASLYITQLIFSSDISLLPQVMSIVASLFLGFVAVLPLLSLQDRLGNGCCILIGLAITLLPVGLSGFEVFGRILNLGFYMPVIAQFVLFVLLYRPPPFWGTVLLHLFVLVLMWTFPVVIGQFAVFILFHLLLSAGQGGQRWLPVIGFLALAALAILALKPAALSGSGGINLPVRLDSFIEFAIARSTLYPAVAAFYGKLSDSATLSIMAVLLALIAVYLFSFRSQQTALRNVLTDYRTFFLLNFGIMLLATVVMRRGLTSILSDYTTTFPDRYFTGVNIMFLVALMVFAFSSPSIRLRRFAAGGFVLMLVSWLVYLPLFERGQSPMVERNFGTLRDTICARAEGRGVILPSTSSNVVVVPIYPVTEGEAWRMPIPQHIFDQTVRLQCRRG